jgi:hypothetical protein
LRCARTTARAAYPIGRSNTTATTTTTTAAHDGRAAKTSTAGSISPTAARAAKICLRCASGIVRCTSDAPIASRRSARAAGRISARASKAAAAAATAGRHICAAASATAAIPSLHRGHVAAEGGIATAAAVAAAGPRSGSSCGSASAYRVRLRRAEISRIVQPLDARGSTATASPRSRRAICN